MEEQLNKLQNIRRNLEEDLCVAKDKQQASHHYTYGLERKSDDNQTELHRVDRNIGNFRHKIEQLEQQIETSRNEQQEFNDQQRQSQHKQDRLSKELCMDEEKLTQSQEKERELEKQKFHLEQQYEQFSQRVQLTEQKIRENSHQIHQTEDQIRELQARSLEVRQKTYPLEIDIERMEGEVRQLGQRLDIKRVYNELKVRDNESIPDYFQQEMNKIEKMIQRIDEIMDMKRDGWDKFERKLSVEIKETKIQAPQEKNQLEHLRQEKQNTAEKLDWANVELNQKDQGKDILAEKVSMLHNELIQIRATDWQLLYELRGHGAELERQKLLDQEFKRNLHVELQKQREIEQDIEKDEGEMRMIEHALDECELREAVARTDKQWAEHAEARAETDYCAAQTALTQCPTCSVTAPAKAESTEYTELCDKQCQSTLTERQTIFNRYAQNHQLKREEHATAKAETILCRTQLQHAKTALKTKISQLNDQKYNVSVKEHKAAIQKDTLNAKVDEVNEKLEKFRNGRNQIARQVVDENQMVQLAQSQLEKQDQILTTDVQQLQQSIASFTQKNRQLDSELNRLKQETNYLDQQCRTELAENQTTVTSQTSQLDERQLNQFENLNASIIDTSKSIEELESEKIGYQEMLKTIQQQQIIEEKRAHMEANLVHINQRKQNYENQIQCLTNDIEEKKRIRNDIEKDISVMQSQIDAKQQQLKMYQDHQIEYEQELTTVLATLADFQRQIAAINETKQTLERDIQQQTMLKQENERLVLESTKELLTVQKNLERVTRNYNDQQKVHSLIKSYCQVLISHADDRRKIQVDIDQQLIQAQREIHVRREEIARLLHKITEVDTNIRTKRAIRITASDPSVHLHQNINDDKEDSHQKTQNLPRQLRRYQQ